RAFFACSPTLIGYKRNDPCSDRLAFFRSKTMLTRGLVGAAAVTVLLTWPTCGQGGPLYVFTKVADTDTPVPGGVNTFGSFSPPSVSGSRVAFTAVDSAGSAGVYTWQGGVFRVVADATTGIPDSTETFTTFGPPSISGQRVAFVGTG